MIKVKASAIVNDSSLAGASVKDALETAASSGGGGGLSPADRAKLDSVQTGATANATDAALRDRSTHTGTQVASTISDLPASVRAVTTAQLAAGTNVTITPTGDTLVLSATAGAGGPPTGTAGGVLGGTYPNPTFATDMATQAELDAGLALKAPVASPTFTGTVTGVTKAMVGLGNADDTSDANKPVSTAQATALALKAPLLNPTITGLREAKVAVAASDIAVGSANVFTKTITAATTFTVSGVPAAGTVATFILKLTNGGAFTVTWFAGIKWPGGTVPTLTAAGRDNLYFETDDGGVTWDGTIAKDFK